VGPLNNNPQSEKSQLLEVQHIAPDANRSWFLEDHVVSGRLRILPICFHSSTSILDGKMVLLTPIDPVFVLIPILRATLPSKVCCRESDLDSLLHSILPPWGSLLNHLGRQRRASGL
jgi:hypothetical protein